MLKFIAGLALLALIIGKTIGLSGEEFLFLFVALFWLLLVGAAFTSTTINRSKPRWHRRIQSPIWHRRGFGWIRPWRYLLMAGLIAALLLSAYFWSSRSSVVAHTAQAAQPLPQPRSTPPPQVPASSAATLQAAPPAKLPQSERVDPRGSIEAVIRKWARVWAAGEVDQYLAMYSESFVPAEGVSRTLWEKARRERVGRARKMAIDTTDLVIRQLSQTSAEAEFVQTYKAAGISDRMHKILTLEENGDQWKITSERAANSAVQ